MQIRRLVPAAVLAAIFTAGLPAAALGQGLCGATGADLVVSHIEGVQNGTPIGGTDTLVLATRQTNVGSEPLAANLLTDQHPVQAPNLYRHTVIGGVSRFEQIGMGWCFHAGIPLNMGGFCNCQGGTAMTIGPGCSDPHSAGAMATAQNLGPRWEVDASTGIAVHPHATPTGPAAGRIRVLVSDLMPGAAYFGEVIVLHGDEAADRTVNNASWRSLSLSYMGDNPTFSLAGATNPGAAAIEAWKTLVPGVSEAALDVPGDGRYILAARAIRVGGNNWNYEYAVFNLNSGRSGRALVLPRPDGLVVSSFGFHDAAYHSGDGPGGLDIAGTDWSFDAGMGEVRWSAEAEESNPAANALRWGTMYNFRITCNMSPVGGEPALEFFRPGEPGSLSAPLPVPGAVSCLGDHDGDSVNTVPDIFTFLASWFGGC